MYCYLIFDYCLLRNYQQNLHHCRISSSYFIEETLKEIFNQEIIFHLLNVYQCRHL